MSGFIDNERFRRLLIAQPEKAITILYEKYYHILVDVAESYVHDRKAAEDIVQETFIHVWERHRNLGQPNERSIEHYLIRVVRNKSITCYNKRLRQRTSDMSGHRFPAQETSTEMQMIGLEISREIRSVIQAFPARERQCLLMKIDEEITAQQIADRLNVSRKAVERSLTSAYKRLRKCLKEKGYAVSGRGDKRSRRGTLVGIKRIE